eukprot:102070-Amphidinium_carterae.1
MKLVCANPRQEKEVTVRCVVYMPPSGSACGTQWCQARTTWFCCERSMNNLELGTSRYALSPLVVLAC